MSRGSLIVLSAPSGAGKTSLVRALRAEVTGLAVSVSHTTRAQRPGERHGEAYFFVDHAEFERMIAAEGFLEYARVFDNYYGTARQTGLPCAMFWLQTGRTQGLGAQPAGGQAIAATLPADA